MQTEIIYENKFNKCLQCKHGEILLKTINIRPDYLKFREKNKLQYRKYCKCKLVHCHFLQITNKGVSV